MALLDSIVAATAPDVMPWLTEADMAAVDLAKSYAETIDRLIQTGEPELLGKAAYLGPHLLGVLTALGGTPKGRKELDLKEAARGKLAEIRDLRARQAPSKKRSDAG